MDANIIIAAGNDKLFASVCDVIGKPELASDRRFKNNAHRTENYQALRQEIESVLVDQTASHWLSALNEKKVPCAKINTMKDLFEYEQLTARNMLVPVDGEDGFQIAGNPIKFMGEEDDLSAGTPPKLGEHTESVLRDVLNYPDEDIVTLIKNGRKSPF